MDFWSELPAEWKALAFVGLVAAAGVGLEVVRSLRDAANSMLLSQTELRRDQVAVERRRRLKVLQRRSANRRSA